MIEIKSRYGDKVLYTAQGAADIRSAVTEAVETDANLTDANLRGAYLRGANLTDANLTGANLTDANLRGANLTGANLTDANLTGANLTDANLRGAYLRGANLTDANLTDANLTDANLRGAYLRGANLTDANLRGAYLRGANLTDANLTGARGLARELTTELMILLEQTGRIRAYKLVNEQGEGPQYGGLVYEPGATIEVPNADTSPDVHCGAGINVATLSWCLREWRPGYRVLVVEFSKQDIAAIPTGTDGKFRLHRCKVIREKKIDPVELGLVPS